MAETFENLSDAEAAIAASAGDALEQGLMAGLQLTPEQLQKIQTAIHPLLESMIVPESPDGTELSGGPYLNQPPRDIINNFGDDTAAASRPFENDMTDWSEEDALDGVSPAENPFGALNTTRTYPGDQRYAPTPGNEVANPSPENQQQEADRMKREADEARNPSSEKQQQEYERKKQEADEVANPSPENQQQEADRMKREADEARNPSPEKQQEEYAKKKQEAQLAGNPSSLTAGPGIQGATPGADGAENTQDQTGEFQKNDDRESTIKYQSKDRGSTTQAINTVRSYGQLRKIDNQIKELEKRKKLLNRQINKLDNTLKPLRRALESLKRKRKLILTVAYVCFIIGGILAILGVGVGVAAFGARLRLLARKLQEQKKVVWKKMKPFLERLKLLKKGLAGINEDIAYQSRLAFNLRNRSPLTSSNTINNTHASE